MADRPYSKLIDLLWDERPDQNHSEAEPIKSMGDHKMNDGDASCEMLLVRDNMLATRDTDTK
jgi:hypothetical protein